MNINFRQALLKNISWNVVALAFTFINNLLLVRLLGPVDSGTFFYTISILTLMITVMRFGIENGLTYLTAKYSHTTGILLLFTFPLTILQSIITFIFLKVMMRPQSDVLLIWATAFVSLNIYLYYITAFFQARKLFSRINLINALSALFQTILLIIIFLVQPGNEISKLSVTLFQVLVISTALQVIGALLVFFISERANLRISKTTPAVFKGLFRFSGLNYINTVLLFLITRVDFYFVEHYCNSSSLGNYIQAAKIGQLALVLPGLAGGVVFPFAIGSDKLFPQKIAFLCRMISFFFILFFAGIILFGYLFFPWLLGNGFNLVYGILLVSVPGFFFASINIILMSFFEGKNFQRAIIIPNLVTLLLIISGDSLLVPGLGYFAAAGTFTIGTFVGMAIFINNFRKKTGMEIRSLFTWSLSDLRKLQL